MSRRRAAGNLARRRRAVALVAVAGLAAALAAGLVVAVSPRRAATAQGSGPVHLRSVLQLLATGDSWRIAAFDSRTGSER